MLKITIKSILFYISIINPAFSQVGFFSPSGFSDEFIENVDVSLFNFKDIEHLRDNLSMAEKSKTKVYLEVGDILKVRRPLGDIKTFYRYEDHNYSKTFLPKNENKLIKTFKPERVDQFFSLTGPTLKKYKDTLEAIFIVDEPYLNGMTFSELETSASLVRKHLDQLGLEHINIGVIYSSAMFNASFAKAVNKKALSYVRSIDNHHAFLKKKKILSNDEVFWLNNIKDIRLTTYDIAGNIYTGGGIPKNIDIIGYDFYLSTLLLDRVHEQSISWLDKNTNIESCSFFKSGSASAIKKQLDFYSPNSKNSLSSLSKTKTILDQLYICRTEGALSLLNEELANSSRPNRDIVIVSESSANGLLDRKPNGEISPHQNQAKIHDRMTDEVRRALQFFKYSGADTLLFFVYFDEIDFGLNLNISGVQSNEAAKALIFDAAQKNN